MKELILNYRLLATVFFGVFGECAFAENTQTSDSYRVVGSTCQATNYCNCSMQLELTEVSTLEDYLAYAALNNPELEAAFNRWKAQLERVIQERTLPDPRFNYAYYIQSVETRVGPQQQLFSISQMFPWFGKLRLRGKAALQAADSAQEQYEALKLKLFYNIKNVYYDYYYLGRAIVVTKMNLELLRQFEKLTRTKYEAGTALFADVLKAQTELDKLDDRLRTFLDLQGPILAKLNAALNRPFKSPLPWPKYVPIIHIELDDLTLAGYLAELNPELRSFDYLAEKERTGIELAKKEFFPDISVGLDYIDTGKAKPMLNCCTGQTTPVPGSGKPAVLFRFSCNLPVWQNKYRAGQREAERRYQAGLEQRIDRENILDADMKQSLFNYRDASRKIALYSNALIPKAEQSLKVTQHAYEAGKADFLSLIDSQRVLLEFELTYEKAVSDHAQALAQLEMLIGMELTK
jgi:cobalt-zinc-cadmium efflux system outer membrane protein